LELVVLDNQAKPVQTINDTVIKQLRQHKGNMPYVDDIALLTIRFK
jgi:serine phosphatase RsbU (regulator of sigma subunit)